MDPAGLALTVPAITLHGRETTEGAAVVVHTAAAGDATEM